jgi:hypothetical protein
MIAKRYAPVAQLDRVTDYESVGRGFESLLAYHRRSKLYIACSVFFIQKTERAHSAAPPLQMEPASLGFHLVFSFDGNCQLYTPCAAFLSENQRACRCCSSPNGTPFAGLPFGFFLRRNLPALYPLHRFFIRKPARSCRCSSSCVLRGSARQKAPGPTQSMGPGAFLGCRTEVHTIASASFFKRSSRQM